WTFGAKVPGPMLRVRQGDTVELTLANPTSSKAIHSIDLHAVTGGHGGGADTQVAPGQSKTIRFKALRPGLYVYHCATPSIPHHIAAGMYGMILVEPAEGLPAVDREFYVMQGDHYTTHAKGTAGHQAYDPDRAENELPTYYTFNGAVGALTKTNALTAKVGETIRIYFGVGGPNKVSSFHVIGEIFDTVYREGSISSPMRDVQTTLVAPGGATRVDMQREYPGNCLLVAHALSRVGQGAGAALEVAGTADRSPAGPGRRPARPDAPRYRRGAFRHAPDGAGDLHRPRIFMQSGGAPRPRDGNHARQEDGSRHARAIRRRAHGEPVHRGRSRP